MVPPPPPFSSFVGLLYRAPAAGAPSPPVNPEAALEDPAWSATIDPNNVPSFAELSTDLFNGWEQAKETGVDWMFAMTHGNKVVGYHAPEAFTKVDTAPTPYDDKVLAFRNSTFHGLPINVEVDLSEAAKPITVITQRTAGIVAHRAANPASKFMPAPTVGTTRTHIKIVFIPYEVRHFHDEPRDYDYYVGTIEPFISAQGLSEKCKHYMGYWTAHAHCTTAEPGKSVLDTPEPTEVTNLAVQGRRFGRVHSLRLTYGATATTGTSTAVIQQVVSEIKVGFSSLVTSTEKNSAAAKAESARRRREVAEEKQQKIANSFGGSLVLERVIKNTGAETKDDLTATAREVIGMDKKADRHTCVTDAFDAVAKGRNWHRKIDSSFMDDDWLEQVLKQKHYGIKPDEQWDKRAMGNVFSFSELTPQMKHKKQLADIIRKYDASVTAADALALATVFVGLPRGSSLINYLRRQVCFSEVWLGKQHWQTKYLDAALTDLESVDDEIYTVGMMKPSESPMRGIYLAVLVNKELRQNWTKVFNGEPVDESSMKTTLFSDIVEGETHWEPRLLESIRDAMQLSRFCNVFAQDPHSSEFDSATVVQQQLLANQLRLDHVLNEVSQVRSVLASKPPRW
ncbi:hypothetical protein THAOC_31528 [Thalassiosira oceanica]|uniref:Uncharacterized protein n=1 Tax=Thalassiosira oceanica TaxID=159749 RepID=K0R7X9_THAOC|nr:hypothetical protein THAOC_31528 [Thalassiosira oceanica]|eukprot:EJK49583.1 hypothetical protein THAOC_31528 [Thalassiosira oceanica]